MPRRIVLSGAPGAGKTTVLRELARRGFRIVPEAARAILREEGGMALRAADPDGFARAILDREVARFDYGDVSDEIVFYDRGLGDLESMPVQSRELRALIAAALHDFRYADAVFRAPAWAAIYRQDAERTQTWEEAVASDLAVTAAWQNAGYTIVDLPLVSPADRADFILRSL